MGTLLNQLLKAGLVSVQDHAEETAREQAEENERSRQQIAGIESERIEKLREVLEQVTSVRRFRQTARDLLLLRPDLADEVASRAGRLPYQEGSEELIEAMGSLREWLPSLKDDEKESLIRQTLG